jgi:hypothetical protein
MKNTDLSMNKVHEKTSFEDIQNHIEFNKEWLMVDADAIHKGEGYEFSNNSEIPKYGVRWAGDFHYTAFYHELSHAVEMVVVDPHRLSLPFFGMCCETKINMYGVEYDASYTTQSIERECRVSAIQAKLISKAFSLDEDLVLEKTILDSVRSLYLMPDFIFIDAPDDLSYKNKEKFRMKSIEDRVREYHDKYDIKDIIESLKKVADIRDYKNWPNEKLNQHSFHDLHIEDILNVNSPLEYPNAENEVLEYLEVDNSSKIDWSDVNFKESADTKKDYLKKTAFFVKHKPKEAIELDIRFSDENDNVDSLIVDGKCRLSGSLIKGRKTIKAKITGDEKAAKNIYLWNPNVFLRELKNREKNKQNVKLSKKKSENKIKL